MKYKFELDYNNYYSYPIGFWVWSDEVNDIVAFHVHESGNARVLRMAFKGHCRVCGEKVPFIIIEEARNWFHEVST